MTLVRLAPPAVLGSYQRAEKPAAKTQVVAANEQAKRSNQSRQRQARTRRRAQAGGNTYATGS
jgi:hypothetical protein